MALLLLTGLYQATEAFVRRAPVAAAAVAGAVGVASLAVVALSVAG